jgi:hypothetical protein
MGNGKVMRESRIVIPVLLLLSSAAVWDGLRIILRYWKKPASREAGAYLVLLSVLLGSLTLAYCLRVRKVTPENRPIEEGNVHRIWIALSMLGGYAVLMDFLGYLLSTALFLVAYLRVFGHYRWMPILTGAAIAAGSSAYTWAKVGLMLPRGILPWP